MAIAPPMLTATPVPMFDSISESGCIEEMQRDSERGEIVLAYVTWGRKQNELGKVR